jgi:hypothetical protein
MKLLLKLKHVGVGSLFYNLVKDMYLLQKARLCVKIGNQVTNSFTSNVCIHQGDVLSPNLFNIFINDLTYSFDETCDPVNIGSKSLSCLLYADDLVLLSSSEKGLQNAVHKVSKYCKQWNLSINMNKTKVVVFNRGGRVIKTNIKIDGQPIDSVKYYKYLGICFSVGGKFTFAKNELNQRGMKAVFKLQSLFKQSSPGIKTSFHLFDHVIKPILLYGSDVWGCYQLSNGSVNIKKLFNDSIEKCQLRFCRYTLGVSRRAPNIGLVGETGRLPLSIEAAANSVKFFNRIMEMPESSYLYAAYTEVINMGTSGSWLPSLVKILGNCNIGIPDLQSTINSGKEVTNIIKRNMSEDFIKQWKSELFNDIGSANGNKLRSYRLYKNTFKVEEYLLRVSHKPYRSTLAKLRLSAHKLQIEIGRYLKNDKVEPQNRLCKYCDLNCCEDEMHFLLVCDLYKQLRTDLFTCISMKFPFFNEFTINTQFIWLMGNCDDYILQNLSKYIYRCFHLRATQIK